jgi:hypothetical protein
VAARLPIDTPVALAVTGRWGRLLAESLTRFWFRPGEHSRKPALEPVGRGASGNRAGAATAATTRRASLLAYFEAQPRGRERHAESHDAA